MDVKLVVAVSGAVRAGEVAGFCREQGISRQTFYKWKRRFDLAGLDGLVELSRRPRSSPSQTPFDVEELVVRTRKELDDVGSDNGAWSIQQRLVTSSALVRVPSQATIWRLLVRRGLVVPAPKKRPKGSWRRFVWERPNDMWQIDSTHWPLADGTVVEIINIIDDHSRVVVASIAVASCTCPAAWDAFVQATVTWGVPARMLSDNGLAFNGSHRNVTVEFETNLRAVGTQPIASTPFHPQTCGKVERYHQTMKRALNRQPPATTLVDLQHQLDTFTDHYNHHRPHRALHGNQPATTWTTTPRAVPATHPMTAITTTRRDLITNNTGNVHIPGTTIGLGNKYARQRVTVITTGHDCAVFLNGHRIRQLTINPNLTHQRIPNPNPRGRHKPH